MHWTVETQAPGGWKLLRRELREAAERLGKEVGMDLRFYPDGRFEGRLSTRRVDGVDPGDARTGSAP